MRLLAAALGILLVSPLSGSDVERALSISRARDAERQQFHHRYIVDLPGPVVTQVEVITEFRKMVLIAEDHVLRGDFMFTRGLREAEAAIKPSLGLVTIRAQVRFNPMNTFIASPPYVLAIDDQPIDTQLNPQFSVPFKGRDKKDISSLIGAALEATVPVDRVGRRARAIGVTLEGKDAGHTTIDFGVLD